MKKILVAYLFSIISCCLYGQNIHGQIFRGNSDTTVANAVVYYSGSTNGGVISDDKGLFQLAAKAVQIPIVASCVGYYSSTVNYHPGEPLIIRLKPKQEILREVVIRVDGMKREDEIALFKKEFLGTSVFARSCIITNIDDLNLHYNKKTRILTADCDKPIIIENKKLGYTVSYYLDKFEKSPEMASMAGTYTFKDEILAADNNLKEIKKNREVAYQGSRMQFIRELWQHTLDKTGFTLFASPLKQLGQDDIVIKDPSGQKYLHLDDRIFVNNNDQSSRSPLDQHVENTFIDKDGYYGDGLVWSGPMGSQRIGDLLPFEYRSEKETGHQSTTYGEPPAVNWLRQWIAIAPQEKVHIHFDKPYYSLGEDIWFKAYVVDAKQNYLSDKSKLLYIDLLDNRDSVKQTLLLPVENGLAQGNIHLSDSLLTAGNYRICAYTKWMQNFGSEYFFRKDVSIVNAMKGDIGQNTTALNKKKGVTAIADVQFFPEGGHLVNGIRTKIGFKALTPDGLGEDISGYIVEEGDNEHLAEFRSEHAGMGVFALMPLPGKTYNAVIKHANGAEKHYPLPKADESGYVLNVNHVGDSLSVRISASRSFVDGREVTLIAQSNGVVQFATKTKLDKASNLSYIPANKFQTGIVQFTLFSPINLPVAERMIFIDQNDGLTASVKTDKTEYNKRGKVNIGMDLWNANEQPVNGSFSVSVTDESKVNIPEDDETTIFSNLLLTSDIRGHIEQPNYYFKPNDPDRKKHLDQLLLTQGWRRFNWAELQANKLPVIKYQPEQSLAVTGRVTTIGNKPIPNGKVTLLAITAQGPIILDTLANDTGHYIFDNLNFTDSAKLVVKTTNAKNSTLVKTFIDKDARINYSTAFQDTYMAKDSLLNNYLRTTQLQFRELSRFGIMKKAIALNEVKIKAKKDYFADHIIPHSTNLTPGSADHVIKQDKLKQETNLIFAFYNIPGIEVINDMVWMIPRVNSLQGGRKPMAVMIDGAIMDAADLKNLPPGDVEGVELLTSGSNRAMYGSAGVFGVILITTKRGGHTAINNSFNIGHDVLKGYTPVKQFYSPAYDTPDQTKMADLRSTIYWNPDVVTGADGKANFSFYNADGTGTYKVTLEGMDTRGGLLRKTFTYVVK